MTFCFCRTFEMSHALLNFMSYRRILFSLTFFLFSFESFASLINNFSFEMVPPNLPGINVTAPAWINCGGNLGTPDVQGPAHYTLGVTQAPAHLNSYAALYVVSGYVERLGQTLLSPLIAGIPYSGNIKLARGTSTTTTWTGTARIQIWGGNAICSEAQLLWQSNPIIPSQWYNYPISFIPNSNYSSIVIKPVLISGAINPYTFIDSFQLDSQLLPIDLFYFNGQIQDKKVKLQWDISQKDVNFFIQRKDPLDQSFTDIGFVLNTDLYSFLDENPADGINQYRLRMVDINDGEESYSETISFDIKGKSNISFYPNPVIFDNAYVEIQSQKERDVSLFIIDKAGRVLEKRGIQLLKGINSITLGTQKYVDGVYILKVISDEKYRPIKFSIQRF